MELKHLRSFLAVHEEGSFTRAGRALNLTQAAISQHIAALEKEYGEVLFQREARSVTLTEAGRRLQDYATRILELVDEAALAVRQANARVAGKVRIAASTIPAEHLLPGIIAQFRQAFPDIHESIAVSDTQVAIRAVENAEVDVGFVGERVESSSLVFTPIAEDELVLVVSPKHSWVGKKFVTPRSLLTEPLILREKGSGSRHCVERAFSAKGIELGDMNVVMEVNSNDAIRAAVEQNVGVAFLSLLTTTHDLEQERLVRVVVRGIPTARHLYMVISTHRILSRAANEFVGFVKCQKRLFNSNAAP